MEVGFQLSPWPWASQWPLQLPCKQVIVSLGEGMKRRVLGQHLGPNPWGLHLGPFPGLGPLPTLSHRVEQPLPFSGRGCGEWEGVLPSFSRLPSLSLFRRGQLGRQLAVQPGGVLGVATVGRVEGNPPPPPSPTEVTQSSLPSHSHPGGSSEFPTGNEFQLQAESGLQAALSLPFTLQGSAWSFGHWVWFGSQGFAPRPRLVAGA